MEEERGAGSGGVLTAVAFAEMETRMGMELPWRKREEQVGGRSIDTIRIDELVAGCKSFILMDTDT
jgi:hypothetical protein